MSKIGKINISIPEKVKVILSGNMINIEGPLGKKSLNIDLEIFDLNITEGKEVSIKPQMSASLLLGPGEEDKVKLFYQLPEKVMAPVEKGSMLGTLELRMGGKTMRQIPLVAAEEVPTQSFFASVAESIFNWSEGDE